MDGSCALLSRLADLARKDTCNKFAQCVVGCGHRSTLVVVLAKALASFRLLKPVALESSSPAGDLRPATHYQVICLGSILWMDPDETAQAHRTLVFLQTAGHQSPPHWGGCHGAPPSSQAMTYESQNHFTGNSAELTGLFEFLTWVVWGHFRGGHFRGSCAQDVELSVSKLCLEIQKAQKPLHCVTLPGLGSPWHSQRWCSRQQGTLSWHGADVMEACQSYGTWSLVGARQASMHAAQVRL